MWGAGRAARVAQTAAWRRPSCLGEESARTGALHAGHLADSLSCKAARHSAPGRQLLCMQRGTERRPGHPHRPHPLQLCAEDYLWWWRSYYRGGSISIYVLIYSCGFLVNTLHK